jgi:hypothetical protein
MAKTNPIGVRFDIDILERIKSELALKTPQAVLNWLMEDYAKNPPPGLTGLDLSIWKAEQKAKIS